MRPQKQNNPFFSRLFSLVKGWVTAPFFAPLMRYLLVLVAVLPIGYTTYRQWPEVKDALSHVQWSFLLASVILLFLSMPLMGIIPWLTLKSLKIQRPPLKICGFYFASQLTKYLPGGVWAYPTRVAAYQIDGIERGPAAISVTREVIALFLGAALVASTATLVGVPSPTWMHILLKIGIIGCLVGIALTSSAKPLNFLSKFSFARFLGYHPEHRNLLAGSRLWDSLPSLLTSGIYWLGAGFSFLYLVKAVNPGAALQSVQAIALFALAWCVGFVIVILPAGFGARETAILYLLKSFVPLADAVAISLLARLCWMTVEAIWAILLAGNILPRKRL